MLTNISKEWKEFKAWAFKSWTVAFNVLVGLFAVFGEALYSLQYSLDPKMYIYLFMGVSLVNLLLRMKTEKGKQPATPVEPYDEGL